MQYLLGQQNHAAWTAIGASQRFDLRPFHECVFGLVGVSLDNMVTDDGADDLIADWPNDATDDDVDLVGAGVCGLFKFGRASFKCCAHFNLVG
ncbi:hypothetical protein [Accumulibacter sp.]|uniref:hypothetical protein n=1 Tax=Accumulibacter sp. TaxID=2053492 RepID=UPI001A627B13|nr:hypothetical protein [Accumulibacter sp.]MBL8374915.1 hypothetical protein [Accumulibacter sp.]